MGTITRLEMTAREQLVPSRPPLVSLDVTEVGTESAPLVRRTYCQIWKPLPSGGRMAWSEQQWRDEIATPGVRVWVGRARDEVLGFAELEMFADGDVGIVVFGVTPPWQGRGMGGALLTAITEIAWESASPSGVPIRRVWLETSSDDHPHALQNYRRRGFREY